MSYAGANLAIDSTSAGGAMAQFSAGNPFLVGIMLVSLGTSGGYVPSSKLPVRPTYAIQQSTTSGTVLVQAKAESAPIGELRRLSGFTWNQLARLFGVSRRSLHFWASGNAMSPANEEHLHRLLATIRKIDRGSASANRAILLAASKGGAIPLDLLADHQYDQVLAAVGTSDTPVRPVLKPLSQSSLDGRRPRPPEELVEALQNSVHRQPGRARAARSVKVRGVG